MNAKSEVKRFGTTSRMKVLTFMMLCTVWAMVWVFVQVEQQAGMDRVRIADVNEQQVLEVLAESYGVPFVTQISRFADPKVVELLPRDFVEEHKVLPLYLVRGVLTVAVAEPDGTSGNSPTAAGVP